MEFKHQSVLLSECIESLNIRPDGIYVDGTLGGGGHSYEICRRLSDKGRLIGIDQDEAAIEAAKARLGEFKDKVTIIRSNYCNMKAELAKLNITSVNGILLDLGVSSYQLDNAERGFTYREDAPLDMRMDQRQSMTAADIVNNYSEMELYRIIRDYGEEKFAKNIAKHIVKARSEKTLETTGELIQVIKAAIPMKVRAVGGHPAKRTFQAIRIELNRELDVLKNSLGDMIDLLDDEGRICIITFHSLEDRIVKNIYKESEDPCICPREFPVCVCGKSKGRVVTRKPIIPSEEELLENKRSKSSKLRVFERKAEPVRPSMLGIAAGEGGDSMADQMNTRRKQNTMTYIEGNTVRQLEHYGQALPKEYPERRYPEPAERTGAQRQTRIGPNSAARRRARNKAFQMSLGYVGFLSAAAVASLFICVNFLRLQAEATEARKTLARMESQYSELKLANDAAYSKAVSSVNLNEIRDIAINELGMVYANKGQIITYEKPDKDYVRQYMDVPEE